MPVLLLLGVIFLAIVGIIWMREQRIWKRFHAEQVSHPETATRLYQELLHAGVRTRYRFVGRGATVSGPHSIANQTPLLLVHRDDLPRAEEVRATMQREGRA